VVRIFASAQTRRTSATQYCSGLAFCRIISLATTMEWKSVAQHIPFYLVPTKAAKGSYAGSHAQVAMLILPTLCPDCNEPRWRVVEHRPNDFIRSPMYGLWLPHLRQDFA
jgi:hypothetical protein